MIQRYLPDLTSTKKTHNREFVVNVLSTLRPNFVKITVDFTYKARASEIKDGVAEKFKVTEEF